MSMTSQGYKYDVVYDVAGVPTGITTPVKASLVDGIIGGLTGAFTETQFTGLAKLAAGLTLPAIAMFGTSKVVSGSWIPRRLG